MKVWNISLTNFLWNVCRKKEAVIFIDAYSAKTEHSLRMSGALFR